MISIIDPVELEHVLRPTVYRPDASRSLRDDRRPPNERSVRTADAGYDDAPDTPALVVG
jgi:hypothetical protein